MDNCLEKCRDRCKAKCADNLLDRRQQKTRQAIFAAFGVLLEHKRYSNITVQDIIEEANIGRSTFYAHFETKDDLLHILCSDIFENTFKDHPGDRGLSEFKEAVSMLEERIVGVLYHLRDTQPEIVRLLSFESCELFLKDFKTYLPCLFEDFLRFANSSVPEALLQNYLVGSFAETVRWWIKEGLKTEPESIASCYLHMITEGVV